MSLSLHAVWTYLTTRVLQKWLYNLAANTKALYKSVSKGTLESHYSWMASETVYMETRGWGYSLELSEAVYLQEAAEVYTQCHLSNGEK